MKFRILDRISTLELVRDEELSCSRFGDGEIYLLMHGHIPFQKKDRDLQKELKMVARADDGGFLVCIPSPLMTLDGLKPSSVVWHRKWKAQIILFAKYYFGNKKKIYGDTFMTRPWMSFLDKEKAGQCFFIFKEIIKNKDVVIIEGEKSRLGVGNDLFEGVKSIKRIIAPATNAYDKVNEIEEAALKMPHSSLFLLALGPTATVLSYRLFRKGLRALDIGHIDVEYGWYNLGATEKIPLEGKYVNEAGGYRVFKEVDLEFLKEYQKEIVANLAQS